MRLVIVGSGAAGLSAVQTIREHDKNVEVILVSRDTRFYSLFALPFYLAGEVEEANLDRFDPQVFQNAGVKLYLGMTVKSVKPESNAILLDNGNKLFYDVLLLAIGASPVLPPIPGLDKDGVVTLANLQDSQNILSRSRKGIMNAVVVGGGFVGIESATALHHLGVSVTIIEMENRLLPRMLDEDTAEIAKQLLEDQGIEVRTSSAVDAILGKQKVKGVQVGQDQLPCELVVIATGVRPNIELVKGTNIATNVGILVDEYLCTTVQNIYAAGDVAEALDRATATLKVNAIWPNAITQGRIAGQNMLGLKKRYEGSDAINLINIFNTPILSIGQTVSEIGECETLEIRRGKVFRKLLLHEGTVLGYQAIGDLRNAGFILQAYRTGINIRSMLDALRKDNLVSQLIWRHQPTKESE